jgi:hypothetical protein
MPLHGRPAPDHEDRASVPRSTLRSIGFSLLSMQVPFRADNAALARYAQGFGVIWTPMSGPARFIEAEASSPQKGKNQ